VCDSSSHFGNTLPAYFAGVSLPICGVIGDQQAALFGQACFTPGMVKNTYGTGSFVLMHCGDRPGQAVPGLLTTLAWGLHGQVTYALEGSIFATGATMQWLRDELQLLQNTADSAALAASVPDTNGVYLVPAFTGLGAPHWDMYARGLLIGLTRGTTRAHIVRAGLEAMAYQTRDVLEAMTAATGMQVPVLRVDGGATSNEVLLQLQSDILQIPVQRPQVIETTALGAAYLAGLTVGYWQDQAQIAANWQADRLYYPQMPAAHSQRLYSGWQEAVQRARHWSLAAP
jgi:glycerol kinase